MSPLCFGSDRSCCCSLFQKRQWNQCMQAIKRNAPDYCLTQGCYGPMCSAWWWWLLHQSALWVFISWADSGLAPHSLLVTINVLFLTFPVFIKALCVGWTPPCPRIRQSSQVWLHLTVWPGAAPLSSLCNLLCSTVSYFSISDYSAVGLS